MPPARCGSTSAGARWSRRAAGRDRARRDRTCRALVEGSEAARQAARRSRRGAGAWPRVPWSPAARGDNAAGAAGIGVDQRRATPSCRSAPRACCFVANAAFSPEPGRGGARVLPLPARHLAPDGRDAVGRRAALDWLRASSPATPTPPRCSSKVGRARGAGRARQIFLPYLRASARRTTTRRARRASSASSHDTDAAATGAGGARRRGLRVRRRPRRRCIEAGAEHRPDVASIGGGARSHAGGRRSCADALERPLDLPRWLGEVGAALGAARLARLAATGETRGGCLPPPPVRVVVEPDARDIEQLAPKRQTLSPALSATFVRDSEELDHVDRSNHLHEPLPISAASRPINFEGPKSDNPLAFRYYDKDRIVLGKRMEDHLRFAVCYWHSFAWTGIDIFGAGHLRAALARTARCDRGRARTKADAAFEFFTHARRAVLLLPRPRRRARRARRSPRADRQPRRDRRRPRSARCSETGVKLLWGTANLFSHPRYMAGAATNPDPEVFAYAAAQVKAAHRGDARASAARTTCCGAAAKATRRCSTPT